MEAKNVVNHLEKELDGSVKFRESQIDIWLKKNPDKVEDFEESLRWFHENRSSSFSWSSLRNALSKIDGWSSFPEQARILKYWAQRKYPELFTNVR